MGVLDRVRAVFRRRGAEPLDPGRTDLVVVVTSFDDVEACSAALDRATGWVPTAEAVLRHHLVLPEGTGERAAEVAGQDGYLPAPGQPSGGATLVLQRVQVLDALHCSQERSRMAGLAQRLGGHVLGWDALQVPGPDSPQPGR